MTTTTRSAADQVATVNEQIVAIEQRIAALNSQLDTANYAQRPPLREELGDLDRQRAALRAQLPPLMQQAESEAVEVGRRNGRATAAARILADATSAAAFHTQRSWPAAGRSAGLNELEHWAHDLRRAAAQLRAAGQDVPDALDITIKLF